MEKLVLRVVPANRRVVHPQGYWQKEFEKEAMLVNSQLGSKKAMLGCRLTGVRPMRLFAMRIESTIILK